MTLLFIFWLCSGIVPGTQDICGAWEQCGIGHNQDKHVTYWTIWLQGQNLCCTARNQEVTLTKFGFFILGPFPSRILPSLYVSLFCQVHWALSIGPQLHFCGKQCRSLSPPAFLYCTCLLYYLQHICSLEEVYDRLKYELHCSSDAFPIQQPNCNT